MDKKAMLRGFGIGVLFAAIILGISFSIRTSDAYVIKKAKEMGMVYKENNTDKIQFATSTPASGSAVSDTDSNSEKNNTQRKKSTSTSTPSQTATSVQSPEASKAPSKSDSDQKDTSKKLLKEKDKLEKDLKDEKSKLEKELAQKKQLTIKPGEWSEAVSQKLQDLGVVKSAKDFDKYLNDNGYGKSISAGTYSISMDDTYKDLAEKITGK